MYTYDYIFEECMLKIFTDMYVYNLPHVAAHQIRFDGQSTNILCFDNEYMYV